MRKPDPPLGTEPSRKKRSSAAAIMTAASYPQIPEPPPPIDSDSAGRRSSGEFLQRNTYGDLVEPEFYPLPPSRPHTATYHSPIPPPPRNSGTSSSSSSSGAATGATGSVRRKKSRPIVDEDGEDSDGAQADAEYIPGGRSSVFVNLEGRARKVGDRTKKNSGIVMLGDTRRELVDERRHSMAV